MQDDKLSTFPFPSSVICFANAPFSLRLGHLAVLDCPRQSIHCRSVASLPRLGKAWTRGNNAAMGGEVKRTYAAMMNDDGLRPNDVALQANDGMIIKIPKSYPKDLGIFIMSASEQAAEGAKRSTVRKLEQAGCLGVIERTARIDDRGTQGAVRRAGDHHSA